MAIDTLALVAMLNDEPEAPELEAAVKAATVRLMSAHRRFGEGRHRAGLNYGDCSAYALATVSGEPLLFKGNDFGHTDIDAVAITGP